MKKTIKLAVVAALALGATSAFATNGANLIGNGAKARGMGGVGVATSHGAESGLANGALITSVKNTEISFGGTIFMPSVESSAGFGDPTSNTSASDMNVIPEVSIAGKINDNFYWGIGMWGTAGMGVDYREDAGNLKMVTNLQLMQFGIPLAYTTNGVSVSVTPVLQYGSLDINYDDGGSFGLNQVGTGVAQDLEFGFNLGLAYEIKGFTIGAMYKSQIDMEYKGALSGTVSPMVAALSGNALTYTNDTLSTPAEIGLGVSYTMGEHTLGFDYRNIAWSKAKGYEDFMWEDQNVYAIGYEYATKGWALRAGYNYSESPIKEQTYTGTNSAGLTAQTANTFNLLGFPGIVESHITLGGTYELNANTTVDLAYVYAPEVSETFTNVNSADITTKHSQNSVSLQANFAF